MSQRPEDFLNFSNNHDTQIKSEHEDWLKDPAAAGFSEDHQPIEIKHVEDPLNTDELLDPRNGMTSLNDMYLNALKTDDTDSSKNVSPHLIEPLSVYSENNQHQQYPLPQLHIEPATSRGTLHADISTPIDSTHNTPVVSPAATPQPDAFINDGLNDGFSPLPSPAASPNIQPFNLDVYDQFLLPQQPQSSPYSLDFNNDELDLLENDTFGTSPQLPSQQLTQQQNSQSQTTNLPYHFQRPRQTLDVHSPQHNHAQWRNQDRLAPKPDRRMRAMSDSWRPYERDAFFQSLDQNNLRNSDLYSFPEIKPDIGGNNAEGEPINLTQFPQFERNVSQPQSPNIRQLNSQLSPPPQFHGGVPGSFSGDLSDRRYNGSVPGAMGMHGMHGSDAISGLQPNTGLGLGTSINVNRVDNHLGGNGNGNGLKVPTIRMRSVSTPKEPTKDLKSAPIFSCTACGKTFTRAYNLRSHMRTHTDERPFVCQHCGKAFARQHDKKRHEALHSGEKKFACQSTSVNFNWGCGKRFARADALARHFRTEAGKICLRPLIAKVMENGRFEENAPEGILYLGLEFGEHNLVMSETPRIPVGDLSEREDQTRRSAIYTAICEQMKA